MKRLRESRLVRQIRETSFGLDCPNFFLHWCESRSRFGEKLGYFVFLTTVFANLAYIVLVRVPMAHADLNGSGGGFLFGGSVCKAVQVLEVSLGAYQFVVACYYLAAVWRRTLYASANSYDNFRYSRHGREGSDV